jgi:hypothetical protein
MKTEPSRNQEMMAVTSWRAEKAVEAGAEAAVVVDSEAVDSAAAIVAPATRASGAVADSAVVADFAVPSEAVVLLAEWEAGAVVAAAGAEVVATVERAALKFKGYSPFLWPMQVFSRHRPRGKEDQRIM